MVDLTTIGLEKGVHYETIITTEYCGKSNSAPIGVICLNKDTIMCRIFNKSKTLRNIKETKRFTVNIVDNPFAFTYSTLSTVPKSYLNEDNGLKCSASYFKCEVDSIKDVVKAIEICKNKEGKPLNRAMDLLVESIYNIRRINENPEYYLKRLKEAKRVITKVGSRDDKKAIRMIIEHLKNEGYEL